MLRHFQKLLVVSKSFQKIDNLIQFSFGCSPNCQDFNDINIDTNIDIRIDSNEEVSYKPIFTFVSLNWVEGRG